MIAIRTGDALKLSAWTHGQPLSGTFSATLDGQAIATNRESGQPIIYQFNTPGNYTINVTYLAGEGQGEGAQSAAYTVHVVSADFGGPEPLLLHYRKSFAFPGLPAGLTTEADSALAWHETAAPGQLPRFFSTAITETGPRHVHLHGQHPPMGRRPGRRAHQDHRIRSKCLAPGAGGAARYPPNL